VFNEGVVHPNFNTNIANKERKPTFMMETQLTKHMFIEDKGSNEDLGNFLPILMAYSQTCPQLQKIQHHTHPSSTHKYLWKMNKLTLDCPLGSQFKWLEHFITSWVMHVWHPWTSPFPSHKF